MENVISVTGLGYFWKDLVTKSIAKEAQNFGNFWDNIEIVILCKNCFGINLGYFYSDISGQSYKHFMLINYGSRVVITSKLLKLTTLES